MIEEPSNFELDQSKVELSEAIDIVKFADKSPEQLLSRVDEIVNGLGKKNNGDVEELLLITLLKIARHAPGECLSYADDVASYIATDQLSLKKHTVAFFEEISEANSQEVSDYIPAMAAASDSDDELVEFYATMYLANVTEHKPKIMYDMREVLLQRLKSDRPGTQKAALAALEPVVRNHPEFALEIQSELKERLVDCDESGRLATASVIREVTNKNTNYLRCFSDEIELILTDESSDVREIGIATFVDLWKEDVPQKAPDSELKDYLVRACEMNRMSNENQKKLLKVFNER